MNRELLLLRHGKSDWEVDTDDFHRPLTSRGKKGAKRIGLWLQENNLLPDYIISSPATRALCTTEKLCRAIDFNVSKIHQDERVYAASTRQLKQVLGDIPGVAKRVLVVGHNPGLESLLFDLVHQAISIPEDGKVLPTATLAKLAMPKDWQPLQPGCAELLSIIRARSLSE